MTTEKQKAYMRDYMAKRRAAGLDNSRPPTERPPTERPRVGRSGRLKTDWSASATPISGTKLGAMLGVYSRSVGALERSAYLDRVIRGEKPAQEAPVADKQFHVRAVEQVTEAQRRAQRSAELDPLIAGVEAMFDDLPDLVRAQDVLDKLDPALVRAVNSRVPRAVAKTLRRLGAVTHDAGNSNAGTYARLYVVRRHDHYAAMKGRALLIAYQAIKGGIRLSQPPAISGRSSKSKSRGRTPARPADRCTGFKTAKRSTSYGRRATEDKITRS
jgi:hypothetical protein